MTDARTQLVADGYDAIGETFAEWRDAGVGDPRREWEDKLVARVNVKDEYHDTVVDDTYRWLKDLDSEATRHWVENENQISKPRLESIPHRA